MKFDWNWAEEKREEQKLDKKDPDWDLMACEPVFPSTSENLRYGLTTFLSLHYPTTLHSVDVKETTKMGTLQFTVRFKGSLKLRDRFDIKFKVDRFAKRFLPAAVGFNLGIEDNK